MILTRRLKSIACNSHMLKCQIPTCHSDPICKVTKSIHKDSMRISLLLCESCAGNDMMDTTFRFWEARPLVELSNPVL